MEEKMITLTTDFQLSEERLEEIFANEKTKALFEKLMQKEENKKKVEELKELLESELRFDTLEEKKDIGQLRVETTKLIRVCILCKSIGKMINGKSLNQAIGTTLKEEINNATVFDLAKETVDARLMLKQRLALGELLSLL